MTVNQAVKLIRFSNLGSSIEDDNGDWDLAGISTAEKVKTGGFQRIFFPSQEKCCFKRVTASADILAAARARRLELKVELSDGDLEYALHEVEWKLHGESSVLLSAVRCALEWSEEARWRRAELHVANKQLKLALDAAKRFRDDFKHSEELASKFDINDIAEARRKRKKVGELTMQISQQFDSVTACTKQLAAVYKLEPDMTSTY